MWDWIYSIALLAVAPLRVIVAGVADRVASIWATITNTLGRWRGYADWWVTHLTELMPATLRHGLAVYNLLLYLLFVFIPRTAADVVGQVAEGIYRRIIELRDLAVSLIDQAVAFARARFDDAVDFTRRVIDWTAAQLRDVLDDLRAIKDHLFGPLASPERLVGWILGALISALVSWFLDNVDTLAEVAFNRRRNLERQALVLTERIVDRLS